MRNDAEDDDFILWKRDFNNDYADQELVSLMDFADKELVDQVENAADVLNKQNQLNDNEEKMKAYADATACVL